MATKISDLPQVFDAGNALVEASVAGASKKLAASAIALRAKSHVISRLVTAPPASPADGDRYLVPTGATGVWTGLAGKIVEWIVAAGVGQWYARTVKGQVFVADEGVALLLNGAATLILQQQNPTLILAPALGYQQVFYGPDGARKQLTFSQRGDFASPRLLQDGSIAVVGPDADYPNGRLLVPTPFDTTSLRRPGTVGIDWVFVGQGQSNELDTNGDTNGNPDLTGPFTRNPAMAGRILVFNGGINPLGAPSGSTGANLIADPSLYDHLVDATALVNPATANREPSLFAAAEQFLADKPAADRAILIISPVGSSNFGQNIEGFVGNRAIFSGSIVGTTLNVASFSYSNNGLNTDLVADPVLGQILSGSGVAAGTKIMAQLPGGTPGGVGTYTVSIAQNVTPGTAITSVDDKPCPRRNLVNYCTKLVAISTSQNRTALCAAFKMNAFEASQSDAAVANSLNSLDTLDAYVQGQLKSIFGQTQAIPILHCIVNAPIYDLNHVPASNINNNNPDTSMMGKVSPWSLAQERWVRLHADRAAAIVQSDNPGDYVARVHHLARGSERTGVKCGAVANQYWKNGSMRQLPKLIAVRRVKGSKTTAAQFDRLMKIDPRILLERGSVGIASRDIVGANTIAPGTVRIQGDTLYFDTVAEAAGVAEYLDNGVSNCVVFTTAPNSRAGNGTWPHDDYLTGLDRTTGQFTAIFDAAVLACSPRTGEEIHDYAPPTQNRVRVTSSKSLVADIITDFALTTERADLDLRNSHIYPGSGTTLTDLVTGSETYSFAGLTVSGAVPRLTMNNTNSIVPLGTTAFGANVHKQNGRIGLGFVGRFASLPLSRYFIGNCRNSTSGGAGFSFGTNSAGRPNLTVRGHNGASIFSANDSSILQTAAIQVILVCIDELNHVFWLMSTANMLASGGEPPATSAVTYSAYTTDAAEGAVAFGKNGMAIADVNATKLAAGTEVFVPGFAFDPMTPEQALPMFNTLTDRFAGVA
jgi:hypothetical protein